MRHIKQEQKFGCVFACIAMVLESDYWTVRNEFPRGIFGKEYGKEEGVSASWSSISYLFSKGFVGFEMFKNEFHSQKNRDNWLKEFAPIHIISLVLNGHNHACVWKNGIIYDPFRNGEYAISDYEKINSIIGFWKIADFNGC